MQNDQSYTISIFLIEKKIISGSVILFPVVCRDYVSLRKRPHIDISYYKHWVSKVQWETVTIISGILLPTASWKRGQFKFGNSHRGLWRKILGEVGGVNIPIQLWPERAWLCCMWQKLGADNKLDHQSHLAAHMQNICSCPHWHKNLRISGEYISQWKRTIQIAPQADKLSQSCSPLWHFAGWHYPFRCSSTRRPPQSKAAQQNKQNIIFQADPFPEQQPHIHKEVSRTTKPGSTRSNDSLK